ncbi:hypothetical protein L227DRAFT_102446 [Lentinus tigrinus ALCF2SS1-6]|uniref:Uncharacterized protein n=1 Tax=Lentinus tigrinus ALCF2SS1-6 TaxID=1328759 RepID=A0A5C2S996_9APHY|nr:hypothetical protein L227DRAFT_102446 [Lentinus tigrinus ALCF2SS1-6]
MVVPVAISISTCKIRRKAAREGGRRVLRCLCLCLRLLSLCRLLVTRYSLLSTQYSVSQVVSPMQRSFPFPFSQVSVTSKACVPREAQGPLSLSPSPSLRRPNSLPLQPLLPLLPRLPLPYPESTG